jgi:hypothetical protein
MWDKSLIDSGDDKLFWFTELIEQGTGDHHGVFGHSIAVDSNGNIAAVYTFANKDITPHPCQIIYATRNSGTWNKEIAVEGIGLSSICLMFDSTSKPIISYMQDDVLKIAKKTTIWEISTIWDFNIVWNGGISYISMTLKNDIPIFSYIGYEGGEGGSWLWWVSAILWNSGYYESLIYAIDWTDYYNNCRIRTKGNDIYIGYSARSGIHIAKKNGDNWDINDVYSYEVESYSMDFDIGKLNNNIYAVFGGWENSGWVMYNAIWGGESWVKESFEEDLAQNSILNLDSADKSFITNITNNNLFFIYLGNKWIADQPEITTLEIAQILSNDIPVIAYKTNDYQLRFTSLDLIIGGRVSTDKDSENNIHAIYKNGNNKLKYGFYDTAWHLEDLIFEDSNIIDCKIKIDNNDNPCLAYLTEGNNIYFVERINDEWIKELVRDYGGREEIYPWIDLTIDSENIPYILMSYYLVQGPFKNGTISIYYKPQSFWTSGDPVKTANTHYAIDSINSHNQEIHILYHKTQEENENCNIQYGYRDFSKLLPWNIEILDIEDLHEVWGGDMDLNREGNPNIIFAMGDLSNNYSLKYGSKKDSIWTFETVLSKSIGVYGSKIKMDRNNNPHILSLFCESTFWSIYYMIKYDYFSCKHLIDQERYDTNNELSLILIDDKPRIFNTKYINNQGKKLYFYFDDDYYINDFTDSISEQNLIMKDAINSIIPLLEYWIEELSNNKILKESLKKINNNFHDHIFYLNRQYDIITGILQKYGSFNNYFDGKVCNPEFAEFIRLKFPILPNNVFCDNINIAKYDYSGVNTGAYTHLSAIDESLYRSNLFVIKLLTNFDSGTIIKLTLKDYNGDSQIREIIIPSGSLENQLIYIDDYFYDCTMIESISGGQNGNKIMVYAPRFKENKL